MAPFNLSEFAIKEIKIPKNHLSPVTKKNYTGKFLAAHFLDFWALFWISSISTTIFQASTRAFMTTEGLADSLNHISFSTFRIFSWMTLAVTYFFCSYYLNHGQTLGMKIMKCRISMKAYNAHSAFRWALMSLSLYCSLGLSFRRGMAFLKNHGEICAHDHLWQELMRQKDMAAPDVRTLVPTTEESFVEAA